MTVEDNSRFEELAIQGNLKMYEATISSEILFECHQCHKTFKSASNWKRHNITLK